MVATCGCGCGLAVPLAARTRGVRGEVKGQPIPFLPYHRSGRVRPGGPLEGPRRIERTDYEVTDEGCWLWRGRTGKMYAYMKVRGRFYAVHRVAYEQFVGPIPERHQVHHRCGTVRCMNPEHLQALTPAEHNALHRRASARELSLRKIVGAAA